ncbi:prolipoprotein diacylglyceryl transferase [Candidatus Latescibacterota bacterium]
MHPTIISIGPFAIRSYGLMLATGFLTGIILAASRAKKAGENVDHIYNISVWIVFSALIGARLYYVMTNYSEFRVRGEMFFLKRFALEFKNMFWPVGPGGQIGISGLILYGGLIAATFTAVIYLYRYKLSVAKFLDIIAPSLGIGEFFTRIGCFLNGCCFGKPTESPIGMIFPDNSVAGMYYPDIHVHPSQLYNSFAGLGIFLTLLYVERYKRFDGFLALVYFMMYAVIRFSTDFTRHYDSNLRFHGFTHNQVLGIIVFTIAAAVMIYRLKNLPAKDNMLQK